MPNTTVRANARTLPEATSYPDANVRALAAQFEAARAEDGRWKTEDGRWKAEEECDAAANRQHEIAEKVAALPSTDMSTMRLKARVYMWVEGADDLEDLDNAQRDVVSGPVLVSLFRDLGVADRPIGSITAPAPDPIFDLIEVHRKAWARIVDAHKNLEDVLSKEAFTFEIKARGSKVDDAKNELLKTPPATLVGARAIIEYLIEWDKECEPEMSYEYLSTLLRSPIFAIAEDADRVLAENEEAV